MTEKTYMKLSKFLDCFNVSWVLFVIGALIGRAERGYAALGGELLLAGIPFAFTYVIKPMIKGENNPEKETIAEAQKRIRRETAVEKIHAAMEEYRSSSKI